MEEGKTTPGLRRYLESLGNVRGYGPALLALVLAVLIHLGLRAVLSANSPAIFFLYLCAMVVAGWCGYGPGLLVVGLAVYAIPYLYRSNFSPSQVNPGGVAALALCSLLISHTSGVRRRAEAALQNMNAALERRIQERTAELQSARDSLETILASIADAVLTADTAGRVVFANPAALTLLRCGESALLGKPVDEVIQFIDEASGQRIESPIARTLRQAAAAGPSGRTAVVAPDGQAVPIEEDCAPLRDGNGAIQGAVLVLRDVSGRRRAEATSRLLASIVESSQDAIISKDLSGLVTTWNRGAERIFGYTAAEMIGKPIALLSLPQHAAELPAILERIRQGHSVELETQQLRKSGELVHVSLALSPMYDALGRIVGASKIARDVTAQILATRQAREARDSLRTTLASIGDAVIATGADGLVVFANPVALGLLRLEAAAVIGRKLEEVFRIVNEFTREPVENPVSKVMRQKAIVGLANHTILLAHDGSEIPIDDSASPIRDDQGEIFGVVLTFRDVTERRRAADALQAARRQLEVITDAMSAAVTRCSRDLRYLWANPQYAAWVGLSPKELEGKAIEEILGVEGMARIRPYVNRVLAGERVEYETRIIYPNNNPKWIRASYVPTTDRDGKVDGWVAHVSDLTAIRQAEADLQQTNAQLARSNEDLERFAFVASHDLQEPLRMITTYAQLLVRKYPAPPGSDSAMFVGNIMDGTRRMRALLSDLLTYAEIGSGVEQSTRTRVVGLDGVIENVRQNLRTAIEETGATIAALPLPEVSNTEGYLVPLFQNLIENAIKYRSSAPPVIRVSWEMTEGVPCFAVSDNGIGIEPEYHTQIFSVFKRLHSGSVPGTGVGLAICKRVVERYGGRIWVESEPGQGSTFRFTMPRMTVHTPQANLHA